ncbi:hypothetical protein BRLA_c008550 [Brevibacillus laterosporus LMG 15441]|uniref:Uncharacterized protein n=1 Tax=Brevibacillus laterosporus LMG 15441 TaxID=1042163 RepID=A0A075R171_BRELA|nr:hypothetical protein BRLA_c008550 [Brevibacillus laterosporus LMG 15441]
MMKKIVISTIIFSTFLSLTFIVYDKFMGVYSEKYSASKVYNEDPGH